MLEARDDLAGQGAPHRVVCRLRVSAGAPVAVVDGTRKVVGRLIVRDGRRSLRVAQALGLVFLTLEHTLCRLCGRHHARLVTVPCPLNLAQHQVSAIFQEQYVAAVQLAGEVGERLVAGGLLLPAPRRGFLLGLELAQFTVLGIARLELSKPLLTHARRMAGHLLGDHGKGVASDLLPYLGGHMVLTIRVCGLHADHVTVRRDLVRAGFLQLGFALVQRLLALGEPSALPGHDSKLLAADVSYFSTLAEQLGQRFEVRLFQGFARCVQLGFELDRVRVTRSVRRLGRLRLLFVGRLARLCRRLVFRTSSLRVGCLGLLLGARCGLLRLVCFWGIRLAACLLLLLRNLLGALVAFLEGGNRLAGDDRRLGICLRLRRWRLLGVRACLGEGRRGLLLLGGLLVLLLALRLVLVVVGYSVHWLSLSSRPQLESELRAS